MAQWIEGSLWHTALYGREMCVYTDAIIKCVRVADHTDSFLFKLVVKAIDPPINTTVKIRMFFIRTSMILHLGQNLMSWRGRREETYVFRFELPDEDCNVKTFRDDVARMLVSTTRQIPIHTVTPLDMREVDMATAQLSSEISECVPLPQRDFIKAVVCGDIALALERLRTGAVDINASDKFGLTALHRAAARRNRHMVVLLLEWNANIRASERDDWTALHHAARYNCTENMRELLDRGADVNATDCYGRTALFLSTSNGDQESVETLLEHGSLVDLMTRFRSRAIEEAADRGYVDILDALQQTAAGQPLLAQAHTNETISERALEYASECLQRCYNGIPRWRDVGPMCLRFVTRQVQRDVNTALSRLGWVIVLCALSFLLPQSVLDMAKVFIPARALAAWESLRR